MPEPRFFSFAPVIGQTPRVLILGSMPSVTSQQRGQYYGHPHNLFWPFMGELFEAGLELNYHQRLDELRRAGVALWDVAGRCTRELSSDASIKDVRANDFSTLLKDQPTIHAVFFNGKKAEELFERHVLRCHPELATLHREGLPSTSPANASIPRPEKMRRWRAVLAWL